MFDNRFMSVKELASYLGIGLNKAYKLCHQQDFPVIIIGSKYLIDKDTLDKVWIPNRQKITLK